MVAVGADMIDVLQSINAEGDQTATPGVGGRVREEEGWGSVSTVISSCIVTTVLMTIRLVNIIRTMSTAHSHNTTVI